MKANEVKTMTERLARFHALTARLNEINEALRIIRISDEDAPCGQTPFTGNTRESRRVDSLLICFSETLGRSPAVRLQISNMKISASNLGRFLETELDHDRLKITAEIEAL